MRPHLKNTLHSEKRLAEWLKWQSTCLASLKPQYLSSNPSTKKQKKKRALTAKVKSKNASWEGQKSVYEKRKQGRGYAALNQQTLASESGPRAKAEYQESGVPEPGKNHHQQCL
jgi:hypothetical protein